MIWVKNNPSVVALRPFPPSGPASLHDVARGRRVEAMNPALAKGTEDVILPGNQIYQ